MSKYRKNLPQLTSDIFLTDGGLETTLIFHQGLDLPEFAAFDLLRTQDGVKRFEDYFASYLDVAAAHGTGFILETPTWRASPGWGEKLGYSRDALGEANREAVDHLVRLRSSVEGKLGAIVISGNIGPMGDGYDATDAPTMDEAKAYHAWQIGVFKETDADLVSAITITTSDEATGIVLAAKEADMPVVIGFTVETDGRLPNGEALADAIRRVDTDTDGYAAYFMVNCAHPSHFDHVFEAGSDWMDRIRSIRGNASTCSHEELDNAEELDEGDPQDFGARYAALREVFPQLTILGGCCGTDHRHISEIARSCLQNAEAA